MYCRFFQICHLGSMNGTDRPKMVFIFIGLYVLSILFIIVIFETFMIQVSIFKFKYKYIMDFKLYLR